MFWLGGGEDDEALVGVYLEALAGVDGAGAEAGAEDGGDAALAGQDGTVA